jgi:5-formyltetrahydrofolate cyclo-ligase
MNSSAKLKIRRTLRAKRLALSDSEQVAAGRALAQNARQFYALKQARRTASYRAFGGEINTRWLEAGLSTNVYLPRITNFRLSQMRFYRQLERTRVSRLGIDEPLSCGRPIPTRLLDVVLVPLVAFRRDGARLGMGAGFYDRAFAFRHNAETVRKPLLVGVAHHFQECPELDPDPWDVPLDVIITDRELIHI